MAIKITIRGKDGEISAIIKRDADKMVEKLQRAVELAAGDVADDIKEKGDRDIQSAGNFGARWTDGFKVVAVQDGFNSKVTVEHDIPYAHIFETGGTIKGQPLLWIPLSGSDAVGLRARDYPGGLFYTQRRDGLELLGSKATGEMKYFGKSSVTIPKKFHIVDICTQAAARIGTHLKNRLK